MKLLKILPVFSLGLLITSGCKDVKASSPVTKTDNTENITVLPVKNLRDDFMMGVDVSSILSVEDSGGKFYDANGKESDALALLKAGGANTVRIRVWNNPKTADGKTYGAGNNDIDTACKIAKRAKKTGMDVLIDFHYSDFWADPNKQKAPKEWENYSLDKKIKAIADFTTDSLKKLKKAGVKPVMVQVGNEINNGMCGEYENEKVFALVKAGADAVRKFDSSIIIAVHYTDPLSEGYLESKCDLLEKYKVDYDAIGTSYYPYWHGDVSKLGMILRKVSNLYRKKVFVAEISYPYTDDDGDGFGNVVSHMSANNEFNYPFSPEGQAIAVRDAIEAVSLAKNGIGLFYWEPAWIPPKHYEWDKDDAKEVLEYNQNAWETKGSGWATWAAHEYDKEVTSKVNGGTWDNQALFDFDGKVMDSINVFNYARNGSKGPRKMVRIENPSVEFAYGKNGSLPVTVKVTYNDGIIDDEKVEWNSLMSSVVLNKPDFGEYKVNGRTEKGVETVCVVKVTASNYLVNGNFETGDLSGWTVENPKGKGNPKVDKNNNNAKEGLCYMTAWQEDDYEYDIWQNVQVGPGKYKCFASFQGTGVKNPSGTTFNVIMNYKNGTSKEQTVPVTIHNVWKSFYKAEIPVNAADDIESITVKAHIKAEFDGKSGNGAWIVMDDVNLLAQ